MYVCMYVCFLSHFHAPVHFAGIAKIRDYSQSKSRAVVQSFLSRCPYKLT